MESGGATMVYQRTFKPQGKMRRRIKDLCLSSFSYLDSCRAQPDLSHNESVRLAVDSMLTQGLEAYHKMLTAEGEVDFLSEPEKTYILQNGTDGCADSAPDASDDQFERLSLFSETELTYKMTSAETDLTLTATRENGVTGTNQVQDESTVQIYFPSEIRPAGIKDLVRSFIREAKMALAIVMECFSDVELLCDILAACKKRNASVHLLLDRSNLNQFVDMWRELKLDGKNFPRFSVRSVVGHTYCARTGRRLTGQMAESFVIRDWTEALTGTYSFSWLSGQVHCCHAVLVKGSTVLPFHQEFHRLYSSSTPVPGFATYESVPRTLPLNIYNSVHASEKDQDNDSAARPTWTGDAQTAKSQTRARPESLAELQSSVSERTEDKDNTQHPQLDLEQLLPAEQKLRASVGQAKDTTDSSTTTDAKTLEKISNHDSGSSDLLSDSLVSTIQSELSSLTIGCIADQVPESNLRQNGPLLSRQHRPPCLKPYLKPEAFNGRGAEGPGFRQRQRDGLFKALGTAARPHVQRRDWSCPPNFKPRVNVQPTCSQALSPSVRVKKDKNAGFLSFFAQAKEHILNHHKGSRHRARAQDQPNWYRQQPRFQSHRSAESLVLAPALSTMSGQYQPTLLLLSDIKAKRNAQFRPAAHHGSIRSAYEPGQQAGRRPCVALLRRSLSSNDRRCFLHRVQEHN